MPVELYQNKVEGYFIIRDGDRELLLTDDQFSHMKAFGESPLLKRLWDQAKKERESKTFRQ